MLKKIFFTVSLVACCNSISSMDINDAGFLATCNAMQSYLDRRQLHSAAASGNLPEVIHLLETQKYDINAEIGGRLEPGHTPLYLALANGHEGTALELLKQGANPNAGSVPPLRVAIEHGLTKAVQALLSRGAHVDDQCRKRLDQMIPVNILKNE